MSKMRKFNRKLYTLYMYGMSGLAEKIEYPELQKFIRKLYTLYMYERCGFTEILNIQNCINSTGNCVHYICTNCLDLLKNWLSWIVQIQREIVYIKCTECSNLQRNWYPELHKFNGKFCTLYMYGMSWFVEKIEYPELRKFNGKLYTLYMYGIFGFAEKSNV